MTRPALASDSADAIIAGVAAERGVSVAEILGPRRYRQLAHARHEAMLRVYEARADLSLLQLGRIFRRDHTTVMHGIKAARARREEGR